MGWGRGGGGQVSIKKGIELGIEEWQLDLLTSAHEETREREGGGRAGRREGGAGPGVRASNEDTAEAG